MPDKVTIPAEIETLVKERGEEIYGYRIKPWTLIQTIELAPVLGDLIISLQDRGINFDNLDSVLTSVNSWVETVTNYMLPPEKRKPAEKPEKDVPSIFSLIQGFLPFMPKILAISLRTTPEEVNEFELPKVAVLAVKVISYNIDYIKNFFGPNPAVGQEKTI